MQHIKSCILICLASLTIASGLQAQYRWHIIHPDRVDTFYYGFTNISCSGENCSAVGVIWGYTPGEAHQMPDSSFIIHSSDGGLTWNSVNGIPHVNYHPAANLYFERIQQINSHDAIAVDHSAGAIIQTFDGWQTFQTDTTNSIHPSVVGKDTFVSGYDAVNFSDAAEGMVNAENGIFYSTLDSGKHWDKEVTGWGSAFRSYGTGMFRVFVAPNKILTTYDGWRTADTSFVMLTDSIQSSGVNPQFLTFDGNDSLAVLSERYDSSTLRDYLSIAISSDLGQNWRYPLLDTVALVPIALTSLDKQTIVIAGEDSSERIVMSTDHGSTWQVYSVPLENGAPYFWIQTIAVTDSGRVIANLLTDSNYLGSNILAYLEPVPSSVNPIRSSNDLLSIYPNPTESIINVANWGSLSILDPLGRAYSVPRNGNTLDVSSLPAGIYFIVDGGSTTDTPQSAKFVKE